MQEDDNALDKDNTQIEDKPKQTHLPSWLSWTVIIIGLAMLVIGMFLGYFIRPLVGPEAQAAKGTATAQAHEVETQVAANQQMMEYLTDNTKHFLGSADAPVTIIEFSDFQ